MTSCNFGDVVLVAFPFANLQATKQRPAVVISSTDYQQNRPDIIVMAITSQVREPLAFGECLLQDWQQARLLKLSVLKPACHARTSTDYSNPRAAITCRSTQLAQRTEKYFRSPNKINR
jgi:hypothetical protein